MTERHSNGFVCIAIEQGTAILTFGTEGEEMVIGLQVPGLPRSEVSIGIPLGCELRDRYLECLTNAQLAAGVRARAEAVEPSVANQA